MVTKRKKRGISTFIATLLLMVLAVSAGVVIYAYVMGYLGGFGGTETLGSMSADSVKLTIPSAGTGYITAYIRNTGRVALNVTTSYVENNPTVISNSTTGTPKKWVYILEGEVKPIYILDTNYTAGTFQSSVTYSVKLICRDNTQLSFSVKATG